MENLTLVAVVINIKYRKNNLKILKNVNTYGYPNFWLDYLKLKIEDIIRPKLEKYKSIYYLSRYIKRKLF